MKPSRAVSLLALGALGLAVGAWLRDPDRTPAEEFALVERRIAAGLYDQQQSLASLDRALLRAHDVGDLELADRVLLARGRLLLELTAYDRARADLVQVLERRGSDPALEEVLIELEAR